MSQLGYDGKHTRSRPLEATSEPLPAAVLLSAGGGSLAAARSLARHGVEVWLAGPAKGPPAASRSVRGFSRTPDPEDWPAALLLHLLELGTGLQGRPVLMPTDDLSVEIVARDLSSLSTVFRPIGPPPEIVLSILDKAFQHRKVAEAGVPVPPTWFPEAASDVGRICEEARFPVLVKPRFSPDARRFYAKHRVKAVLADGPAELSKRLAAIDGASIVQGLIPGDVTNMYEHGTFVDRGGRVVVSHVGRKLDEYPNPFGNATAIETVHSPAVERMGEQVIEALGFRGVSHAEFKHDRDTGALTFIEFNPRLPIHLGLQVASEAETLFTAYLEACRLPFRPRRPRAKRTVWLAPMMRLKSRGTVFPPRRLPSSLPGPTRYTTDLFRLGDPLPLLKAIEAAIRRRVERNRRPS